MDILSDTKQKARKVHRCDWCNLPIEKGEIYRNCKCKLDDIYTWKSHLSCDKIVNKLGMEDWTGDGITQEQFQEDVQEYVDSWDHQKFTWAQTMEFAKDKLGINNG